METANYDGIAIIFDAVLNHKAGADHTEAVIAVKVDPNGNILMERGSENSSFVANQKSRSNQSYQ